MKYTDQELIDELHRVSEEHCDGERPRAKDIDEYAFCSSGTYVNRFGSWTESLKESNLFERERDESRISKSNLKEEIKRLSEEYCQGEAPSQKLNREHGKYSVPTYQDRFGSWNKTVKACGYKPNNEIDIEEEELLKDLNKINEKCNKIITANFYRKHGKYSVCLYCNKYGSWNEALKEANIQKEGQRVYSDEMLLRTLERISIEQLDGGIPKAEQVNKYADFSYTNYIRRFGSFENAIKQSSIDKAEIEKEKLLSELKRLNEELERVPKQKDMTERGNYGVNSYYRKLGGWSKAIKMAGMKPYLERTESVEYYYGPSWYSARIKANKRDGESCRVCGSTKSEATIEVHHITPVKYWRKDEHEEMNKLRNLICLCRSCHRQLEGEFMGRNHEKFESLSKGFLDIEDNNKNQSNGIFDY